MFLVRWRTILKISIKLYRDHCCPSQIYLSSISSLTIMFTNETHLLDPCLHCSRDYLKLPCGFKKYHLSKQDLCSPFSFYQVERL